MTVKDFKYIPFTHKLKTPFQNASLTITERKGFIISISDEFGNTGYGECSSLPGLSRETLTEAEAQIKKMNKMLSRFNIEESLLDVTYLLSEFKLFSSVQFGIEQSLISLLMLRDKNFAEKYFDRTKDEIEVNAVIGLGETEIILSKINEKIQSGYKTFKLKVGRENFEDDLKIIENIRKKFGDEIAIRLDVNGKWSLEDAKINLMRLTEFDIQFVEEPCSGLNNLIELSKNFPIQVAVDESLHSFEDAMKIVLESDIKIIVLKPMILCGMISSIQLIGEAEKQNKKIVISSSFESAVGKSGLVFLASLTNHSLAHGLGTSEYFENEICADVYGVTNGKISFSVNNYPPKFELLS